VAVRLAEAIIVDDIMSEKKQEFKGTVAGDFSGRFRPV
jgi:hypothetical protein